jgi:hypothetical protein
MTRSRHGWTGNRGGSPRSRRSISSATVSDIARGDSPELPATRDVTIALGSDGGGWSAGGADPKRSGPGG